MNPSIAGELKRGGFDALLIHSWAHASDWIAIGAALAFRIPILLRAETSDLAPTATWKVVPKRLLLGGLFRRAAGLLATGSHGVAFYRGYGVPDERIFVMPYAVDNEFFRTQADPYGARQAGLRAEFGIPTEAPVVLFSGKLIPRKRPADLLESFARARRDTGAALVFVGDGDLRDQLEAVVRTRGIDGVYFAGFRNQSELPQFYALADLLVLPSAFESWGLVVNEAMCFGLPVLATDRVGATGDLVRHGVNGFVFPVGDVRALAEHLGTVLGDVSLRRRMSDASRELISGWDYETGVRALKRCLAASMTTPSGAGRVRRA